MESPTKYLEDLKKMLEEIKGKIEKQEGSTEEGRTKILAVEASIAEVKAKIIELEERVAKHHIPGLKEENEKKKFSIFKVIQAHATGNWKQAEFEREVMDTYRKAMDATTGSSGGYLVPPEVIMDIIEKLNAQAVVAQAGATIMSGLMGSPIEIPKQSGSATAYWVAENSAITASDLTLGQLSMTPHQCAALVKLSNRLIKLSNPAAEGLVRNDISTQIALAIDLAALRGTGSSNQPAGIANTVGISTYALGANGGAPTFEALLEMEGKLEDENALRGSLNYVMHGKCKRMLKKTRIANYSGQTDGSFVILPMSDQNLRDHMGYGFFSTSQIPTNLTKGSGTSLSEIYFANWADLIIAQWGGLELATSNVAGDNNGGAFSSNQTWVRAIQEVDIGLRNVKSFCLINDATTA